MGWKAEHTDGREVEQISRTTVIEKIVREDGDPHEWTFTMTRCDPEPAGGSADGRPGYVGGSPLSKWQARGERD